jgi:response regulator RpfG family c-di-GMP phosphodiesterase
MEAIETSRSEALRSRILIVDDEKGPRESLRMILSPGYEVLCAGGGTEALEALQTAPVDVVTLDLNMPGIKGEALMHSIRSEYPDVEVIVITGYGTLKSATEGLRAGICDYLAKPFDVVQVTAAVSRAVTRRLGRRRLVGFLEALGDALGRERDVQVMLSQVHSSPLMRERVGDLLECAGRGIQTDAGPDSPAIEFLEVLGATIESQSPDMRGHARRVALYAGLLAERLGLSTLERGQIRMAAFLHDLGKVGIPSDLLNRPARLDLEEHQLLRRHPEIGSRLVHPLGLTSAVVGAIRHHHERWDGRGYPDGLREEQIPLAARVVALADAYDAMTSPRPYRPALTPEDVLSELRTCAGSQFDPVLAKEFLAIVEAGLDVDAERMAEALEVAGALASREVGVSVAPSGGTVR